ncbi:expressed unknown protein [Seminavis robusta]|uniref:Uncharacterized protein n=1 Tax=Seminavis robusta TaxID=568900 RepID=A0A9N8HSK4_9STRA|nr:expressed unknown protein [Seminavis robusta]|eukprot:Sro1455_g274170.1 n/a (296) ;mRNA; r:19037-19924
MNSSCYSCLLLVLVLLLALATSTQASLLRWFGGNTASEEPEQHHRSGRSVRRSRSSKQLFTNPRNHLVSNINVNEPIENMACEIHELLQQTLTASSSSSASRNKVSLTDDLSGVQLQRAVDEDACTLSGKVRFSTHRVKGLRSIGSHSMELIPGSEDYEEILDSRGYTTGYKWNGVWKVTATVEAFKVDVTSQVDVDACGEPLDFTAFGGIDVNGTSITATVRVDGELSKDLSRGDLLIESAEILSQDVNFESISHTGGLSNLLPLNYDSEFHSLVEYLVTRKLEHPVITASAQR